MQRNNKILLVSLGGAAVIAGAFYYFSRRNMNVAHRYEKLLKQYEQEMFLPDQLNLNIQLKFDQLLNFATFDQNDINRSINERIQYPVELQQGACSNYIKAGSIYYECFDCSPIRQELVKTKKVAEKGQTYLIICEDCFDASKHKGHDFIRIQSISDSGFRCFCGNQNLMEENSFCEHHQGFHKTKDLALKQKLEYPSIWNGVEKYLLDLFHMVFDRMSDIMFQKCTCLPLNKKQKESIARLNILLSQIIDKMKEIIELNPPAIHIIADLFQKPIQKAISLQLIRRTTQKKYKEKWQAEFSKNKSVNNDISIYEYILIFYQFIDDKNDRLLNQFLSSLIIANSAFNLFFIEKFFKYIAFTLREDRIAYDTANENINELALPNFANTIMEYISLQNVFEHLINSLGEDIFTPLDFLTQYMHDRPSCPVDSDNIIYLMLNISFEMFRFVNQLSILLTRLPEQTIERLYLIAQVQFLRNSISLKDYNNLSSQQIIQRLSVSILEAFQFEQIEKHIMYCFMNLCEGLLLNGDESLTQKVIPIFCRTLYRYTLDTRQHIDDRMSNIEFKSFSLTLIIHLPLLVALSERKMFSREVLHTFFNRHFAFDEGITQSDTLQQQQVIKQRNKNHFFESLSIILDKFFFINSKPNFVEHMNSVIKIHKNSQLGHYFQEILSNINEIINQSSYYRVYDFFTLTHSILILIDNDNNDDDQEDCDDNDNNNDEKQFQSTKFNAINQYISIFNEFKQSDDKKLLKTLTRTSYQIMQMLFDSTPFLNVFSTSYHLYFAELNSEVEQDSNNSAEYYQFKTSIEELIVQVIQINNQQKMYLDDLKEMCSNLLNQPTMIEKYIKGVCLQTQKQQSTANEEITLLPQYKEKCFFRHMLRSNNSDVLTQLSRLRNKFTQMKNGTVQKDIFELRIPSETARIPFQFDSDSLFNKVGVHACLHHIEIVRIKKSSHFVHPRREEIYSNDNSSLSERVHSSSLSRNGIADVRQLIESYRFKCYLSPYQTNHFQFNSQ